MSNLEQLRAITIDPEFENVCPSLTKDEETQLEANILADGEVTSPLIVWNGVLLDGHNRRRIILQHPEIPFSIREIKFENRFDAVAWICKNQLGRRNLTDRLKDYLLGKQYNAEKKAKGSADGFRGNQYSKVVNGQNVQLPKSVPTCERIAAENGVNSKYVCRAEDFALGVEAAEAECPGIKEEILSETIRPPKKEVEAIAKAPEKDRKELVKKLRMTKEERKKQREEERKARQAAAEAAQATQPIEPEQAEPEAPKIPMEDNIFPLSSAAEAEQMARVGADSVIQIIAATFDQARKSCESYISDYPELLTTKKTDFCKVLQDFTDYYTRLLKTIGGIE